MTTRGIMALAWLIAGMSSGPLAIAAETAAQVWACLMEDTAPTRKPGRCPACGMRLVQRLMKPGDEARMRAAAAKPAAAPKPAAAAPAAKPGKGLFHCPMHPQIIQDKPGECPICFMQLVPIKQEEVRVPITGRAVVRLDAGSRRQLGIATEEVRTRPLVRTVRLPGRVAHDPELYAVLSEYRAATAAAERIKGGTTGPLADVLAAANTKLAHFGITEAQARAYAEADHVRHLILPGEFVWIHASAFEQDLPWLARGQAATIEVTALSGRRLTGQVEAIEPSLDPVSRTATVRMLARNTAGSAMRLEMYATIRIEAKLGEGLVVSRDAITDTGERKIVFVVRGDELEPREIETGVRVDDGVEVRQGLVAGELVVTSGNFLIDADSQIRAAVAAQVLKQTKDGAAPSPAAEAPAGHGGHAP